MVLFTGPKQLEYRGDVNTEHLIARNIWIQDFLKVGFQMVQFSNVRALTMAIVPIIWKTDDSKSRHFAQISYGFWQNGAHLSGLKMVRLPEHRSHSKSGLFATQPLLDHTKSRLVQDFRSPLYFNNSYNENGQNRLKIYFVDHCTCPALVA